jgi:hypothetical protein
MSDTRTFELILSPSESHEDDDAVLAIYEFDRPTHTGDSAFLYLSMCRGPGGFDHSDESLAA